MDFCGSKAMLASIDRQRWVLHMEFGLEKMQGLQYPNLKWWMTSRRFLVVLLVFFARHLMIVVAIGYVTFCLFVVYSLFLCFFCCCRFSSFYRSLLALYRFIADVESLAGQRCQRA